MSFALPALARGRPSPARLRTIVEVALVLLLALQAARLLWLWATPIGPLPGAEAPVSAAAASIDAPILSGDPFFRSGAATAGTARDAALGFRLFAVRADAAGGGAAILAGKDGVQAPYRVGEALADGVELAAVGADHVLLRTGGGEHRLSLDTAPANATTPPSRSPAGGLPSARTAQAPAAVDPEQLLAQAGLRPRSDNGRVDGYTLVPRGDGALLRRAGLQPGDVLLAVNGQTLTPERMSELQDTLSAGSEARLSVERDGATRTITLRTTQP